MVPEPVHREWLTLANDGPRFMQILAPRGHAKSEYFGLVHVVHYIARHPTHRVLLISSTDDMAQRFASRIGEILRESPSFRAIFPDFPRVTKATQHEVRLSTSPRDPALRAVGWGTTVTGARADLIVLEDMATNENQSEASARRKMKEYVMVTLMPVLVPGTGRIISIGTPYNLDDIYVALHERAGFAEYVYACYTDPAETQPLWPSRFSAEELEATKRRIGQRAFTSQYLCRRVSPTGEVYQDAWFDVVDELPEMREYWLAFDLALSSKSSADYTAITLGGLGREGSVYLINVWRNKWEPEEAQKQLSLIWTAQRKRFGNKLRGMLSEDSKEGRVVRGWMASNKATKHVPITLLNWDNRDKYTRACDIIPFCEAHRVKLASAGWNEDFMAELLAFTKDDSHSNDDMHDTMVTLVRRMLGAGREPKLRIL